MRTVVILADARTSERIAGALRAHGNDVLTVKGSTIPLEEVANFKPELVLCLSRDVPTLRSALRSQQVSIIAVLPQVNDQSVNETIEVGADDFLPATACASEIIARAGKSELWSKLRNGVGEDRIKTLQVWQDAPTMLSQDVGAIFGLFMYPVPFDYLAEGHQPDLAASISMTASTEQAVVKIFVGISRNDAERLGAYAFGGAVDEAVIRDALREIANNLAGSFKRAALPENYAITLGLPTDCRTEDLTTSARLWVAESEHFCLVIGLTKGQPNVRRLHARDLEPGMVLKNDVRFTPGAAHIRAGTALTERTAARLREHCDPFALIEILQPE